MAGLLPVVLAPLGWTAVMGDITIVVARSLERDRPRLINEMHAILGAAAAFPPRPL